MTPFETLYRKVLGLGDDIVSRALRPESMMRSYQCYLADKIVELPAVLGAAEMSLGKSAATLTGVRRILRANPTWRCIIVAPKEVAKNTWPDEIGEWEHLQDLTYSVVVGTAKERLAALEVDADLTIINRENLQWLWHTIGGKEGWRWQVLAYDESSRLKGFTKRTKGTETTEPQLTEFGVLCMARSRIKKVIELSGTPAPNGLIDLGGQARILFGPRSPLGENKTQFKKMFFIEDKYSYAITERPNAQEEIMGHLKPVMIGLRSEDYIDLPPRYFNPILLKFPPKLRAQYAEFEKTLYHEEHDVEAVNKGVLTNKLLQFCIAKDTPVLTNRGWVAIQYIDSHDKIWDGVEWVSSKGNTFKGVQPVVSCYGVDMTIDHKVLTVEGWKTAGEILHGNASTGFDREKVRLPDSAMAARHNGYNNKKGNVDVPVPLRQARDSDQPEFTLGRETPPWCDAELWLHARGDGSHRYRWPRHERRATVADMESHEAEMPQSEAQGFCELRRPWYRHARFLAQGLLDILGGCASRVFGRFDARPSGQRKKLQQVELPMGFVESSSAQHPSKCDRKHTLGKHDFGGGGGAIRHQICDTLAEIKNAELAGKSFVRPGEIEVYDLIECGPRNRFVVQGTDGPLIVHNCNGGLYRSDETVYPPKREVIHIHDLKIKKLESIMAEAAGKPVLVAYSFKFDMDQIRKKFPKAVFFEDDPNFVKNWNAGKIKMGVAHPASIGHGLNLQYGGFIQVWYGLTWSLELWDQFNRRLARPGQPAPTVFVHVIMIEGTEDERQYETLQTRGMTQDEITNRVRVRLAA